MEVDLLAFDPSKASIMVLEHALKKYRVDFPASSSKKTLVRLFRKLQEDTKNSTPVVVEKQLQSKEEYIGIAEYEEKKKNFEDSLSPHTLITKKEKGDEISLSGIEMRQKIGSGSFGNVYLGVWNGSDASFN